MPLKTRICHSGRSDKKVFRRRWLVHGRLPLLCRKYASSRPRTCGALGFASRNLGLSREPEEIERTCGCPAFEGARGRRRALAFAAGRGHRWESSALEGVPMGVMEGGVPAERN